MLRRCLLLCILHLQLHSVVVADATPMALAIEHFNNIFFRHASTGLSIYVRTQSQQAQDYFQDLLDEMLQPLLELKVDISSASSAARTFSYFNIVLVDSYSAFRRLDVGAASQNQDFSEFYLIVLHQSRTSNSTSQEMAQIFDYCWQHYIVNVDILVQESSATDDVFIELHTYYPFSHEHCHKAEQRKLNGAHRRIKHMAATELFPQKIDNFYNCTLMAALWNVPPYLVLPTAGHRQRPLHFSGMEGYLLHVLAEVMNFSLDYVTPPNNEQRGLVRSDGTVTGAIKLLRDKQADLSLGSFRCTLERSTALSPTNSFYQTLQIFTVLSTRTPWSSFEIITYPFNAVVWSAIAALLLVTIAKVLLLEQFQRRSLLFFLYGCASAADIILNLVSVTLGNAVNWTPSRNFARYLLCMWLLLALVLRSSYQALLYDFLNSKKTIDPPDTVQELTQRHYQMIVNVATADSISDVPVIRDNKLPLLVMNITDVGGFPLLEADTMNRFVTGTPRDFLLHYVQQHRKFGVFHILEESIFTQQICIYFSKHSYLTQKFDEVLLNLRSFGLIYHWGKQYLDSRFVEDDGAAEKAKQNPETPLTMTQFVAIFQLLMILWSLAFFVFVAELLWYVRCGAEKVKSNELET